MSYKSVLIITYGRSGSTLLQGILNSLDGYLVRGENYNFCLGLFDSYNNILMSRMEEKDVDRNYNSPRHPFYGGAKLDEKLFLMTQKKLIKELLLADKSEQEVKCYGFKEIRYFESLVMENLEKYLDFLQLIFDDVALIFNTRDATAVSNSGWWVEKETKDIIQGIHKADERFKAYASKHDNCIVLKYENIINKTDIIRLFDFLSEKYDEKKVAEVLGTEHSYDNKTFLHE